MRNRYVCTIIMYTSPSCIIRDTTLVDHGRTFKEAFCNAAKGLHGDDRARASKLAAQLYWDWTGRGDTVYITDHCISLTMTRYRT